LYITSNFSLRYAQIIIPEGIISFQTIHTQCLTSLFSASVVQSFSASPPAPPQRPPKEKSRQLKATCLREELWLRTRLT